MYIYIYIYIYIYRSRGSVVGIAAGYGLDDWGVGVRVPVGPRIFSTSNRPDRLWGPLNLLSNGYRGALSPGGKAVGVGVKLTIHLQLVPRSRKCGSIRPVLNSLSTGTVLPMYIYIYSQSQLPRGLKHERSSLARTLGSWVRIPLRAWMFGMCMRLFYVCVVLCVGSSLATGWSLVQGVLPSVINDYGIE
jgi:hypothetical protein